jgi:hypothetical protein
MRSIEKQEKKKLSNGNKGKKEKKKEGKLLLSSDEIFSIFYEYPMNYS